MTRAGPGRADQRGSGTVLAGCILMLVVMLTLVGLWSFGWITSRHRVGQGADLAALAGAGGFVESGAPDLACGQAREATRRLGLRLDRCTVAGEPASFVVTVTVCGELRPAIDRRGVPSRVCVTASAGTTNARP